MAAAQQHQQHQQGQQQQQQGQGHGAVAPRSSTMVQYFAGKHPVGGGGGGGDLHRQYERQGLGEDGGGVVLADVVLKAAGGR
jgi:hypothetical protein